MRRKSKSFCQIDSLELRRLLSTIYVSAGAPGATQDGTSWATAFTSLQSALAIATSGTIIEVGQGTYKPTTGTDRTATFQLKDGVEIDGGFAGYGQLDPSALNGSFYPTILSGDIGTVADNSDNSYHVVTGSGTESTAMLDGVTVTGGNANGAGSKRGVGGGILTISGSPAISDCTITGNSSAGSGGALYDESSSSPIEVDDCFLTDNTAGTDGGGIRNSNSSAVLTNCTLSGNDASEGAALYDGNDSSVTLSNCTLIENTADHQGGAVRVSNSSAKLKKCTLSGNTAGSGGALYDGNNSSVVLSNCVLAGNNILNDGGAIRTSNSSANLTNCTISGNTADAGGGIYNRNASSTTLTNCILWRDTAGTNNEIDTDDFATTVTYSDIKQSGFTGTGDIDANPQFSRSPGTNGPTDYGDLSLESTSPCIDAGSNAALPVGVTTDLAGNSRIVNTHSATPIVDMGAYEYGIPISVTSSAIAVAQFSITFSANVAASLAAGDLQLTPAGSTTSIAPANVSYNSSTNTATFDTTNLAGGVYAASISPTAISDASGNILSGGFAENLLLVGNNQTLVLPGSNQTYTVQQWTFGSNSSLDIGTNMLIIQYTAGNDPASSIAALIAAGDADGQWNGLGITSSSIATDAPGTTAVGYYDDTTDGQITIRRSWIGDANVDGSINSDDLSLMMLGQVQHGTRWQDGNFNYGTQVNADDWSRFFYAVAYSNGQNISNTTLPAAAPAFSKTQIASADDLSDLLDSAA